MFFLKGWLINLKQFCLFIIEKNVLLNIFYFWVLAFGGQKEVDIVRFPMYLHNSPRQ
jgi:hypothetical protein